MFAIVLELARGRVILLDVLANEADVSSIPIGKIEADENFEASGLSGSVGETQLLVIVLVLAWEVSTVRP